MSTPVIASYQIQFLYMSYGSEPHTWHPTFRFGRHIDSKTEALAVQDNAQYTRYRVYE